MTVVLTNCGEADFSFIGFHIVTPTIFHSGAAESLGGKSQYTGPFPVYGSLSNWFENVYTRPTLIPGPALDAWQPLPPVDDYAYEWVNAALCCKAL